MPIRASKGIADHPRGERRTAGSMFVFASLLVLIVALLPALQTVPGEKPTFDVDTPYGYTWSLLLFALPVFVLACRSAFHRDEGVSRRAMWMTIGIFAPIGFLLDIFLGLLFFEFPNAGATIGWYLPGYDWQAGVWAMRIPVEEFAFYGFGVTFVVAFYSWLDENFLNLYQRKAAPVAEPVVIHWGALGVAVVLIAAAVLIRKYGPAAGQPGFPGWAIFLILIGFLPAGLFYNAVRDTVNWRAFAFTALTTMFISVIWEVTLALPYQWWAFREEQMLGLYIGAWTGIPIEEPVLWVLVSFTTIISYEAVRKMLERRRASPIAVDNTGVGADIKGAATQ